MFTQKGEATVFTLQLCRLFASSCSCPGIYLDIESRHPAEYFLAHGYSSHAYGSALDRLSLHLPAQYLAAFVKSLWLY